MHADTGEIYRGADLDEFLKAIPEAPSPMERLRQIIAITETEANLLENVRAGQERLAALARMRGEGSVAER